jgi:hypothetical protein
MSDRSFDRLLDAWMDLGPTTAPDRVAAAARLEVAATRQERGLLHRASRTSPWARPGVRLGALATAALAAAVLGYAYLMGPNLATPSPSSGPSATAAPSAGPSLRGIPFPELRGAQPGTYGWASSLPGVGTRRMQLFEGDREVVMVVFSLGPPCLGNSTANAGVPVQIAGYDAIAIDRRGGDRRIRQYAISIADRLLCVDLYSRTTTTEDELNSALAVLDTIRAQPIGEQGIRITFDLAEPWGHG